MFIITFPVLGKVTGKQIEQYCEYYRYDNCLLVKTLIQIESSFNERSYHPEKSGSYGLMQIQCSLAKQLGLKYGCEQLFNPQINVRFGILYLKSLEKQMVHPIDIKELLSLYNGGISRIFLKIGKKRFIQAKRCLKQQIFKYEGFPQTICYPGEYINEFYVWKAYRLYRYLIRKNIRNKKEI